MRKALARALLAALTVCPVAVHSQQVLSAPGPKVGEMAPDFTLSGATRYGLLKNPVKLSDYRGSTVVLAFFYQARTRG